MKIKKVKIEGFGLFNEPAEFSFDKNRLNIIYGDNEAGKTTLLKSIIAAFFGLDKNRWSHLKSLKPAAKYSVEIQFTNNDIEYKLLRDFESNQVHFRKKNQDDTAETLFIGSASPQSRNEEKEHYYDALKKVIGINNEAVFKNINVIYQKSIESNVDREIQQILTGTIGTNYKNIIEQWTDEYFSITKKSAWTDIRDKKNNREMEFLEKELEELTANKDKIFNIHIKSLELMENIKNLENQIRTFEEEVRKNKAEYELTRLYLDILKEKNNHEDKLQYFSQDIEKYNKLKSELDVKKNLIENKYPDFKNFTEDDLDLIKESSLIEKELKDKNYELDSYRGQRDIISIKKIIIGINGIIIAGMVFIAKLIYNEPFLLYICIGLGLFSAVFLIRSIINKYKTSIQYKTQLSLKKGNIYELNKKMAIINKKIQHLSKLKNKPDLFEQFNEYKKVIQDLNNLNYAMNQMSGPKEYSVKKDDLSKSLISINTRLEKLEDENPGLITIKENRDKTISYIQNLKEETGKKEIMIEELKKQVYNINKDFASMAPETESLASIDYRIIEVEDEILRYNAGKEAYELAVNTLNEAITEYQEKHIDRLSKNISNYYKNITKEKHTKVVLTEDFEPMVQDKDIENLKNLSCGAEDQLYFSIRLALLKELNNVTSLPLFLDDPFVNFDKNRLEVVKDILYSICGKNQIILFTHIKPYSQWDKINLITV